MTSQQNHRLDYLDAVRAFALILGIVFHASLSYMPMFIGWAVMDVSTSQLIAVFVMISHSFRMELFFLIAGFFSHLKFHQLGLNSFFKSRLVRIAIPFIVGWVLLRPLLVSGWVIGAESMRGDANITNGFIQGFNSLGNLPKDLLTGTHLWFLYYLLLVSAGVVVIRFLIDLNSELTSKLTTQADRFIGWLIESRFTTLICAIPTACCLWFMNNWGVDTPDKSLMPQLPVLLLYAGFFIFGWLLHRQSNKIELFSKLSWAKLALCITAILCSLTLVDYQSQTAHPHYIVLKFGFMLSYAIMMWSLVSLTIGVCKKLFSRPSNAVRYLADSSYWLYLIHLPIVIWLQIAVAELPYHWAVKLLAVCSITILFSLVLYDLFVRSTFIGHILNGKKNNRALFSRRKTATEENETVAN